MECKQGIRTNNRVVILGAGELGYQAAHYMELMKSAEADYTLVGWIDDTKVRGSMIGGVHVLGGTDSTEAIYEAGIFDFLFIAIGYNHLHVKLELIKRFKDKIPLLNIIVPSAYVDSTAILGENLFIYPGVVVDKNTTLKDGVLLNIGTVVSHNSSVGECTFLAPGTTVAGFSEIGSCSFIGAGSVIIDNIKVCDDIKLGAGTLVVKDIEISGMYYGAPAKFIR